MTVCIGALCASEDGTTSGRVVVASDRMVTMGGLTEFEHEVPKLMQITDTIVALIAGDALRGARLCHGLTSAIQSGSPPVEQVADMAANHYADLRRRQINSDIFAPRGISLQQFYTAGLQQSMLSHIAGMIDQQVMEWDYGVEFLLAGIDGGGSGRIFLVGNPGGSFNEFGQIGFTAIGSGAIHAVQSMIGFEHTGSRDLHDTVFAVYASKRRAEAAPGVGRDTDLAIVTQSGITRLTASTLEGLEDIYQEYQLPAKQAVTDKVAALNLFQEGGDNAATAID